MRKKSIKKAVTAFEKACGDLVSFVTALEEKDLGGQAISWGHDYAIIRLYREFETLMLECIVASINNDTEVLSQRTGIKFPKHLTDEVCEYIVIGNGYFDFRGRDGLIKTLKSYLDKDHFVVKSVSDKKFSSSLEKLSTLRNFAAHDSAQAKKAALSAIAQERVGSAGSWLKRRGRFADICDDLKALAAVLSKEAPR
jgi:hypothetical protein